MILRVVPILGGVMLVSCAAVPSHHHHSSRHLEPEPLPAVAPDEEQPPKTDTDAIVRMLVLGSLGATALIRKLKA